MRELGNDVTTKLVSIGSRPGAEKPANLKCFFAESSSPRQLIREERENVASTFAVSVS
jgi:hypothetical protein